MKKKLPIKVDHKYKVTVIWNITSMCKSNMSQPIVFGFDDYEVSLKKYKGKIADIGVHISMFKGSATCQISLSVNDLTEREFNARSVGFI